jgi:hypothetical protein
MLKMKDEPTIFMKTQGRVTKCTAENVQFLGVSDVDCYVEPHPSVSAAQFQISRLRCTLLPLFPVAPRAILNSVQI